MPLFHSFSKNKHFIDYFTFYFILYEKSTETYL